jgi:hypothetical protein
MSIILKSEYNIGYYVITDFEWEANIQMKIFEIYSVMLISEVSKIIIGSIYGETVSFFASISIFE